MDTNDQPVFSGIEEALDFMTKGDSESDSVATTTDEETLEDDSVVDDETEAEEAESDDSDEQTEDEDDEEEGDDTDEEEDDDFLFSIEDDQGEFKVKNVEEAKKGYLRQRQFTKVTQEVAAERKALKAQSESYLDAKSQYLDGIAEMKAASSEQLGKFMGIDWEALQKDDPYLFDEKRQEFEAAKLSYGQAREREDKLSAELTAETMEYAQGVRTEEMEKLMLAIPELSEKGNTLLSEAKNFATESYGFSEDELLSIYDSRQIQALVDAYRYNQSKSKLATGKAKAGTVKKSMKAKGSTSKTTAKARQAKAANKALNRPGGISVDEALEHMMKS